MKQFYFISKNDAIFNDENVVRGKFRIGQCVFNVILSTRWFKIAKEL